MTIATPINTKREKNVASTAITTSSTTTIVKAYSTASLKRKVEPIYYLTKIDRILQKTSVSKRGKEKKQKNWKTSLVTNENQDVFFMRQVICQAKNGGLQLAYHIYQIHKR